MASTSISAAALDARIQDHGGHGAEETVMERAARLRRSQEFASERERFHRSEEGVNAAKLAYQQLIDKLVKQADDLQSAGIKFQFQEVRGVGYRLFIGRIVVLVLWFEHTYANSLDGAKLRVEFYRGVPRLPGVMTFQDALPIERNQFTFELVGPGRTAWVSKSKKEYPIEAMPDLVVKLFMDHGP